MASALENKEVQVKDNQWSAGENQADFVYAKANEKAKSLWTQYKLDNVVSREDLVNKLDVAINELNEMRPKPKEEE